MLRIQKIYSYTSHFQVSAQLCIRRDHLLVKNNLHPHPGFPVLLSFSETLMQYIFFYFSQLETLLLKHKLQGLHVH